MEIAQLDEQKQVNVYNVKCQNMTAETDYTPPFDLTWCELPPQGSTFLHAHHGYEAFTLLKGEIALEVDGEKACLEVGDCMGIKPFASHKFSNVSSTEKATMLAVYCSDSGVEKLPEKVHIFSPPLTPNGTLHLGHLSGPYLAADILSRFLRLNHKQVRHEGGTDDFQSYVPYQATLEKCTENDLLTRYQRSVRQAFKQGNFQFDAFLCPHEDTTFQSYAKKLFARLVKEGVFTLAEITQAYCETCAFYLSEAEQAGQCPYCHTDMSGNTCESCAMVSDLAGGLNHPVCRHCQTPAKLRPTMQYVFALNRYKSALLSALSSVSQCQKLVAYQQRVFATELAAIPMTRYGRWGLQTELTGGDQVINVWFILVANYLYRHTKQPSMKDATRVCFFGIDNNFFGSIFMPALFIASGQADQIPHFLLKNEFYLLSGSKFSTGKPHAIWAGDLLSQYNADAVRFYLALTRPECFESNFCMQEFDQFCNTVLSDKLGVWVKLLEQKLSCRDKHESDLLNSKAEKTFFATLQSYYKQATRYYGLSDFSPKKAAAVVVQVIEEGYYFSLHSTHLTLELTALKCFALVAAPMMPTYSDKLLAVLQGEVTWERELILNDSLVPNLPRFEVTPIVRVVK
jgi:methionyl-tRNA synthetase